uniref:Terpenoid cyclases Protein prenyltransferases family protein n=1 Tax=Saccharum hybrid cultivar R570 TaxID=131158 RepID=A0A059Q223_9POAL|nr:Terpenoid cyclases Protein prenyltransferases family protein [Saccharum hybrid cultivar R570]
MVPMRGSHQTQIALKIWNVGRDNMWRGLHFIGRNFSVAMDEQVTAPIDFNITFPGLLSLAIDMGLKFPIRQTDVHGILHRREMD